jgi:hypothetical protein
MTDTPISGLTEATVFGSGDEIAIVQSGETKRATRATVQTGLVPSATESVEGILEIASSVEAEDLALDNKIMTPLKMQEALAGGNIEQIVVDNATAAASPADGDVNAKRLLQNGIPIRQDFKLLQVKDFNDSESISFDGTKNAIVMDVVPEYEHYCLVLNNVTANADLWIGLKTSSWQTVYYGRGREEAPSPASYLIVTSLVSGGSNTLAITEWQRRHLKN